ncbi:hypothetical protein EGM51_14895 [Verrucomicrobia bacterium S94]|nr:hypothetical protein EGM51_14895 [Verrucomicrobia bacterium S94]
MSRKNISIFLLFIVLTGIFTISVKAEKPMHPAVEKLDLDGDMVLFLNTETLEQRILDHIDKMGQMVMKSMTGSTPENVRVVGDGVETIKKTIEWSGLFSLKAYAMSMAPAEKSLSRVISIGQHAEKDAGKPIWRLLGSAPHQLKGIEFVPSNAVYTANSSISLDETWKIVNEAVNEFGGPEAAAAFDQQIMMAQMLIGTNISAITESIENDILISLQLSNAKTVTLPQHTGTDFNFPEPSLLIGFGINDPLAGNIILQKLQQANLHPVKSMHGENELYTVHLSASSPFPLSPTLVMTDDYLLIGSTLDLVKGALGCAKNKTGLVATPLYKQLLNNAPDETTSLEFISPRFMTTYLDVLKKIVIGTGDPELESMMDITTESFRNLYFGSYTLKTPTGFYSESYINYGSANPLELAASSYFGLLSAIAIPSFQKARSTAQESTCRNNRRIIESAKEQWAMENGKPVGTPVTEADISEYIPGGFNALVCPNGGTYSINPVGMECTCSVHTDTVQ